MEACRNRDIPIVDLLLKHGARDDDCKALSLAAQNKDETLTAKLLAMKVCKADVVFFICKIYIF